MKKIFSVLLVAVIAISCFSAAAYAAGVTPRYAYTSCCSSTLFISGKTATCESDATGYYGETTKIVIDQTLQKYNNSTGKWTSVATWSETDYAFIGTATNTKSGLSSGSYRLKTVFSVYAGVNYEQITVYSDIKSA